MSVIQEEKTGVIELYYDMDAGSIREDVTNATRDFYHPGAQVEYVVGDAVQYRLITLPNGRTITKDIRKK
ncbi:MAG: hypothetical protein C0448_13140 [Sphingobacteriaceae bacterium]|nr:hypothetical protein [Sphingobacteriaceae bacterium]